MAPQPSCSAQLATRAEHPGTERDNRADRLEKLYEVLLLEKGAVTQEQCDALKQLIAAIDDEFALSDDELGHTDHVQHHVDTGDSPPITTSMQSPIFLLRQDRQPGSGDGTFGSDPEVLLGQAL